MLISDALLARIRGEYHEMPGLKLTFSQACRLWQLDSATCESVLRLLVSEGCLGRTSDGAFVALPKTGAPLKAHLVPALGRQIA